MGRHPCNDCGDEGWDYSDQGLCERNGCDDMMCDGTDLCEVCREEHCESPCLFCDELCQYCPKPTITDRYKCPDRNCPLRLRCEIADCCDECWQGSLLTQALSTNGKHGSELKKCGHTVCVLTQKAAQVELAGSCNVCAKDSAKVEKYTQMVKCVADMRKDVQVLQQKVLPTMHSAKLKGKLERLLCSALEAADVGLQKAHKKAKIK